jgi:hypothetical protein
MIPPGHKKTLPGSPGRLKRYHYLIVVIIAFFMLMDIVAFKSGPGPHKIVEHNFSKQDSAESKAAFLEVYKVLMSPRCMNCHPAGDIPLQGDDSHLHLQGVKRGPDGTGLYALKCANCHQTHNLPGLHMPPGNPKWRLPPADMKMIFQSRTPRELALQLLNKKMNGGRSIKALVDHITNDTLVLSGWTPAEGLSKPPLTHQAFVQAFNEWVQHGAIIPDVEKK